MQNNHHALKPHTQTCGSETVCRFDEYDGEIHLHKALGRMYQQLIRCVRPFRTMDHG